MNFLKSNITNLLLIALLVVIVLQRCGNGKFEPAKADTVRTTKTEYIPQPTVQVPQYQPIIFESKQPVYVPQQYQQPSTQPAAVYGDLLKQYQALTEQNQAIINKLIAVNTYKDSIPLKDSSGNRVGVVNLHDVVSENEIKSRNPSYTLRLPVVTNTVTITKPYEPRRQVYFGGGLQGKQTAIVNAAMLGLIYKDRQDRIFKAALGTDFKLQPFAQVETYWKIKF